MHCFYSDESHAWGNKYSHEDIEEYKNRLEDNVSDSVENFLKLTLEEGDADNLKKPETIILESLNSNIVNEIAVMILKNQYIIPILKKKYLIPTNVTPENIQTYITKVLFSAVVNILDLRSRGYGYDFLKIAVENAKKSKYYDKFVGVKGFMPTRINTLLNTIKHDEVNEKDLQQGDPNG